MEIISITVTVEVEGKFSGLFGCHTTHVTHIFRICTFCFLLTCGTGIGKTLLHIIYLRIKETISAHQSGIEHTERGYSFETFVGLCSLQRVATTATDTENTDAICIHSRILRQNIGGTADVLYTISGLVRVARLSLAGSLIGCIEGEADIACLGHTLAIQPGNLLFHPSVWVGNNKNRIAFHGIVPCRGIDIGRNFQSVQIVSNGMNVYSSLFVFRDSVSIDQSERIVIVTFDCFSVHINERLFFFYFHILLCAQCIAYSHRRTQYGYDYLFHL